jgi:hypothetical protein
MAPPGKMMMPPPVHPADATLQYINSNPYFIGLMMLTLNLGGRFISLELSKTQEAFFQNPWVRRFLIFTVLFVGTRNIAVAFWMTLFVVLLLGHLLNENSSLCIYSGSSECKTNVPQPPPIIPPAGMPMGPPLSAVPGLSHEESTIYKTLHDKVARFSQTVQQRPKGDEKDKEKEKEKQSVAQTYLQNMMMLRAEGFANPRF